jgi:hypothetical protein
MMNMSDQDLAKIDERTNIVIFDGVCHLCESSVLFIINRDPQRLFSFCAAQSAIGVHLQQQYQINTLKDETVILISDGIKIDMCYLGKIANVYFQLMIFVIGSYKQRTSSFSPIKITTITFAS